MLLGLLACSVAMAGLPLDPGSARFRRVDSSLGLTQDSVLAIAQDRDGFLWLGTQDGLNRFDGYGFSVFRADGEPGSLGSNWIGALASAADGSLWVGTSAGLFRYDQSADRFDHITAAQGFDGGFVYRLHIDADGVLWVGSDAGLARQRGERFEQWPDVLGARSVRAITADAEGRLWLGTQDGLMYFDPRRGALLALPADLPVGDEPVNDLLIDRHGLLWIATENSGVFRVDPASGQGERMSAVVEGDQRGYALLEDGEGAVWVGMDSSLLRLPPGQREAAAIQVFRHRPHDAASVGRGRVPCLLQDRDAAIWVCTWDGGASLLHPASRRFASYHPDSEATSGLLHPAITSLAAEGSTLWLGSQRGVYRYQAAAQQLVSLPGSDAVAAYALVVEREALWVGSDTGLLRFDRAAERWEAPLQQGELASSRIRRVLRDQGRTWLHAVLRGLYIYESDDWREPVAMHRFAGQVNNLFVLDANTVLVSASDGLYWFDRDGRRLRHRTPIDPAGSRSALPGRPAGVHRDIFGRLWVAVYGAGLASLQLAADGDPAGATFTLVTRNRPLANLGVNAVLSDEQGRLWMPTDRGISRFDPEDGSLRNFDRDDGALGRGYYFSAAATLDSGWLAFGSKDGFTVFDPLASLPRRPVPTPRLTRVERDGEALRARSRDADSLLPVAAHRLSELVLPPDWGRSLLLRFASPEFVAPGRLRYRYRLEGYDPDWIEVDAGRRIASYGRLPPNDYLLRLQAIDGADRHSEETRIVLRVAPYWWQTLPAQLGGIALAALLLWALYALRVRHLHGQQLALEARVAERTQALSNARQHAESALRDLQTTQDELVRAEKLAALGQLVAGVAHEVNTPLGVAVTASSHLAGEVGALRGRLDEGKLGRRELTDFLDGTAEGVALIERNLQRAVELVRSFKQVSVDRSSDGRREFELAGFLAELTQSLRLLWKHRPVTLQIDCPPGITLDSFPGTLGQVLTNLAQNALLHAFAEHQPGCMRIEVRELDAARIALDFSDDGRGIPPADLPRVFEPFFTTRRNSGGTGLGLHIVHNLVTQKLGGSLAIDSQPGLGTTLRLRLPRYAP